MTQHAQERALERYNINLSKRDEYAIIEQIRNNAHTPLNLPTTVNLLMWFTKTYRSRFCTNEQIKAV